jgi:predicted transcriptional regulator
MITRFTVRMPDDLMARLRELAERNRRSVHAELLTRLEHGIQAASTDQQGVGTSGRPPA